MGERLESELGQAAARRYKLSAQPSLFRDRVLIYVNLDLFAREKTLWQPRYGPFVRQERAAVDLGHIQDR